MKLTVERLLSIVGGRISNEKNIRIVCPRCKGDECYISTVTEDHPGQCLRKKHCGWTFNIYSLLKELGKLDTIVSGYYEYRETLENTLIKKVDKIVLEHENISLPVGFYKFKTNDYLVSRGWNSIDFEKYLPGETKLLSKLRNRIIFPLIEDNFTKGYITRSIFSKEYCEENNILRYFKNEESNYQRLVYGLDDIRNSKTVILTEGIFDTVQINHYLNNDSEISSISLLGTSLSIEQVMKLKLKGVNTIIFFLDKDVLYKVKEECQKYTHLFENIFVTYSKSKDPGDSSFQEIEDSLLRILPINSFLLDTISTKLKI